MPHRPGMRPLEEQVREALSVLGEEYLEYYDRIVSGAGRRNHDAAAP